MHTISLKEIATGVFITLLSATIISFFVKISNIEKDTIEINQAIKTHSDDILTLKKSRESLSDYYVTRREFNSYMKDFEKKIDSQDHKLEKIIDILVKK